MLKAAIARREEAREKPIVIYGVNMEHAVRLRRQFLDVVREVLPDVPVVLHRKNVELADGQTFEFRSYFLDEKTNHFRFVDRNYSCAFVDHYVSEARVEQVTASLRRAAKEWPTVEDKREEE